jgi:hypothetical protein
VGWRRWIPVLAALAAAAAPATASARTARFWATATGHQAITWDLIDHPTGGDCFHTRTQHGGGEELYAFKANKTKVRVTSRGSLVFLQVGTWDPSPNPLAVMTAFSHVSRDGEIVNKVTPGPCGGTSSEETTGPYDCGTHTGREAVSLQINSRRRILLGLASHPHGNAPAGFNRCPISTPSEVSAGDFTPIQSKPVKGLFNPKRKRIAVQAVEEYEGKTGLYDPSGARVQWKLTMTRAK